MKRFYRAIISLSVLVFVLSLAFTGCRRVEEEKPVEAEIPPPEMPGERQALVTFLSGEAFALREKDWQPMDIGDFLTEKDTVKVADDSYCELQFGNSLAVRIQENTQTSLETLFLRPQQTRIGLKLAAGTVLFKVGKLVGDERIKIKTLTAVVGIRGTRFMVRAQEAGTLLAVKTGKVTVFPSSIEIDRLKDKVKEKSEQILKLLEQLEASVLVVEAGREITVTAEDAKETQIPFSRLEELIDDVLEEIKELEEVEISAEKLAMLNREIEAVSQSVAESVEPPAAITDENRKALSEVEKIRMIEIPASVFSPQAEKPAEPELVKIVLHTHPEDAEILLNGDLIGKGNVSGIFNTGERLSFLIRRQGYQEKALDISAEKGGDAEYEIKLEAEKKEEAAVEEVPHTEEIGVRAVPSDAEILLNGEPVGRGSFSRSFLLGESLAIRVSREGYEEKTLEIVVARGSGRIYDINLELKPIVGKYSISGAALTGNISFHGERTITADSKGIISVSDLKGNIIQTISLGESPAEGAFPVIIGGRVYFLGAEELMVADINTGDVLKSSAVQNSAAYPFGRSVVEFGDKGLYPDNERLKIFALATGDILEEIKIPDGSRMTPVISKNRILIVNLKGLVLKIDEEGGFDSIIPTGTLKKVAVFSIIYNNLAFFCGSDGTLLAVDLDEGEVLWSRKLLSQENSFHELLAGGEGVYAVSGGVLYASSVKNGQPLFEPISGLSSCPLYHEGLLYLGMDDGRLRIVNARSGATIKSLDVQERITAGPVFKDAKVLVGTESGNIILINPAGIK